MERLTAPRPLRSGLRALADAVKRRPWLYRLWRALRRRRHARRPPGPRELRRHARALLTRDPSFAGEGAHLERVLDSLGLRGGFIADIAAGDGITQSGTLRLLRQAGGAWRGLAVEADPDRFLLLAAAYRTLRNVSLDRVHVTPDNIAAILRAHDVSHDFEVLDLDLDSYDLFVVEALLAEYRPLVVSMEINEKVPPPIDFAVLFRPDHVWSGDHFYGCSIVAACRVLKPRGYILEGVEYNNAFFVRRDRAGDLRDLDPAEAYDAGYRNRPDRRVLFPWNADLEPVLTASPRRAAELLHRHFHVYAGRYRLTLPAPEETAAGG